MVQELRVVGDQLAEMTLEHACPLCGGSIDLRVAPEGSRGVCVPCQVISTAVVRRRGEQVSVNFPTVAKA